MQASSQSNKFEIRAPPRRRVKNEENEDQPLFLRKAYAMLSSCPHEIGGWGSNGDTLLIKDVKAFSDKIIPTAYKHNNFSSFVRQLNFYGFRKIKSESLNHPEWWEFRHPQFIKGEPQLLSDIKRSVHFAEFSNVQEVSQLKNQVTDLNDKIAALHDQIDKLTDMVTDMKIVKEENTISIKDIYNDHTSDFSNNKISTDVTSSNMILEESWNKKRKIKKEPLEHLEPSMIRLSSIDSTIMIEDFESNGEVLPTGPDLQLDNNLNFFSISAIELDNINNDKNIREPMVPINSSEKLLNHDKCLKVENDFPIEDDIFDLFKYDNICMQTTQGNTNDLAQIPLKSTCNKDDNQYKDLPYASIIASESINNHSNINTSINTELIPTNDLNLILNGLPDELKLRFVDKLAEFMATQLSKNIHLHSELIEANAILTTDDSNHEYQLKNTCMNNQLNHNHDSNHHYNDNHYGKQYSNQQPDLNNYVLPSGNKAPEIAIPLASAAITAMLTNMQNIQNINSITKIKEEII